MKNIISKILMAMAVVVMPLALNSCDNEDNALTEPVSITGTGVSHHEVSLEIGQTLKLYAARGVLISGTGFEWSSSDTSVVTIDQNGMMKAVKAGVAVITARTTGSEITNEGKITVYVVNLGLGLVNDELDQSEAE